MSESATRQADIEPREGQSVIKLSALPDPEAGTLTIYNPDPEAKPTAWITSDTSLRLGDAI